MAEDDGDGFATLLRELKDRSGLSYGTLAKRLHMSTSTLHRYCNGTAVPTEYAPVERLARLCRASPEELVELHRQWILADATRGRRAAAAAAPGTPDRPSGPAPEGIRAAGDADHGTAAREAAGAGAGSGPGPDPDPGPEAPAPGAELSGDLSGVDLPGAAEPRPRRKRSALIAAGAAAAVLGAAVLAVNLPSGGGNGGDEQAAGATASVSEDAAGQPRPSRTPSTSASASRSAAAKKSSSPSATAPGAKASRTAGGRAGAATGTPLTVTTRPYVYASPCSQHFLVDSDPGHMGPPAGEQDAPRWAAAYGAVSSGEQRLALNVQGTGEDTVVLNALHVRVISSGAPLAWNDYSMGVGCGGGVETKSFDVNLDAGSPTANAAHGQRDFPYSVSESDPEVFYITARTRTRDVRWDLSLEWSSGSRHGTVHIDNAGAAFHTSANTGRPGYDYPLGGGEWIKREVESGD
jgi:plasmid maintenance system antidote protein VapI